MNIAFCNQHPYWGGLNNDGGSLTIGKSAAILNKLGHRTVVVTKSDKLTWIRHEKPAKKIPADTEACVAASASAVGPMLKAKPKSAKAFWWMRGIELWQMPKEKILRKASKVNMLVNAGHLQAWLAKRKIPSSICYSGLDLEDWKDLGKREKNGKTKIGCLYCPQHPTKRWEDYKWLAAKLGSKTYEYYAFGREKCHESWLKQYYKEPSREELVCLYNKCDIWFSPSRLEGFHNVPAEATLCGCYVVANGSTHSGVRDYINNRYQLYDTLQEAIGCIKNADYGRVDGLKKSIRENIGDRKTNMKKLIEAIKNYENMHS